jgi:hypothetical protein
MAYLEIDSNKIKVGDPITKELLDLIKSNFADHEERLNTSETTGGTVFIFNGDISFKNFNSSDPFVFYHKVTQNCSISEFRAQLFSKDGVSSGSLSLDLQKSVDTNDSNFNSILSSNLSFNFASDAAYSEKVATINSSVSDVEVGDVLRIEIVSLPSGFSGKLLMNIGAE